MKILNKLFAILIIASVVSSCNRDTGETDYLDNRENTVFFARANETVLVRENEDNIFSVTVSASAVSQGDMSYDITLDDSSTGTVGTDFTVLDTNTSFSNGNIVSTFRVQADFDNASIAGKTAVFNLSSTSGNVPAAKSQFSLIMTKFCPIEADFTGDYVLSVVDNGIFDTPTFTPSVVTVSVGATDTERVFSVAPYPAFGSFGAIDFTFSLICGAVNVGPGQLTGVGCGGVSTTLGPADTNGTYDFSDDSMFTIIYTDDEGGASCAADGNVVAQVMLTKV